MDNRPIGMFDSGVGGLTVYKEVKKELPNEQIIYLGDTKRFPYGSKTKETIIELTKNSIDFLIKQNVKAIIIACGTATSQALKEVKPLYDIPIIGIIEPTIEYIKEKGYKDIGIIATRGTIRSKSWENGLREKIENANITNKECPLLAPMAEEGWTDNEVAKLTIKEYLKEFNNPEALILGCTHYPLFYGIIKEILPRTEIINTGTIIARYLKNIIKDGNNQEDKFYLTDTECNFINVADIILNENIKINKANT